MSRPAQMDIAQLRREYTRLPLERESLNGDPIEQFSAWLKQAAEERSGGSRQFGRHPFRS